MELLNKTGKTILDYRRTYMMNVEDIVRDRIKNGVYELYKNGQIQEKLFRILLDENVDEADVYSYLLSKREYTKSSAELTAEFNVVRQKVNERLVEIGFTKNVTTQNSINTNRIHIIKQYDIPRLLLERYFGVSASEIIPLMKRRGFMDKYCVLRLFTVFQEIYSGLSIPEHIDHSYSKIYYNNNIKSFSIDYHYIVNINYIQNTERLNALMVKIKELDAVVEKLFEEKVDYCYIRDEYNNTAMKELQAKVEEIFIPIRTGKRSQDIRKPELIVEEALGEDLNTKADVERPTESPTKITEQKACDEESHNKNCKDGLMSDKSDVANYTIKPDTEKKDNVPASQSDATPGRSTYDKQRLDTPSNNTSANKPVDQQRQGNKKDFQRDNKHQKGSFKNSQKHQGKPNNCANDTGPSEAKTVKESEPKDNPPLNQDQTKQSTQPKPTEHTPQKPQQSDIDNKTPYDADDDDVILLDNKPSFETKKPSTPFFLSDDDKDLL